MKLKKNTQTLIFIGTGGVGKTTLSAAVGAGFAAEGKKVLVLTIDPSKRLAQTLKIENNGLVNQVSDNLFACTINHEQAFIEFVVKAAKSSMDESDIKKILNNKLFKQLSTNLSGSQEFTSLIKLNEFVSQKVYDLVILDTPPAHHTMNFLNAPEKIAQLFNEGVAQWFREADQKNTNLFKRVFNIGTQQVLAALEKLTGAEFIKELALFFQAIQKWQAPLERQINDCHKLLISQQTEFALVTALDPSRLKEAEKLSNEIVKQGYSLTHLIINRVPEFISLKVDELKAIRSQAPTLGEYLNYHVQILKQLEKTGHLAQKNLSVYKATEVIHNQNYAESNLQELQQVFKSLSPLS